MGSFSLSTPSGLFGADNDAVINVPLNNLINFPEHPFSVKDDDDMSTLIGSISACGVLVPLIVRQISNDNYQIISGHRRAHAAQLAGLSEVPCIVRDLSDDEATISMVDSNLARENILPSEKAFAYRMKLEAQKHQGIRGKSTSDQIDQKSCTARDSVAKNTGDSSAQVQRFIRLTYLVPQLLAMVDSYQLAINTAVSLSFLSDDDQQIVVDAIQETGNAPSGAQAKTIRHLSDSRQISHAAVLSLLGHAKRDSERLIISSKTLHNYFPQSYTPRQMHEVIESLLKKWSKTSKKVNHE